jgi:hypothetical protein
MVYELGLPNVAFFLVRSSKAAKAGQGDFGLGLGWVEDMGRRGEGADGMVWDGTESKGCWVGFEKVGHCMRVHIIV